MSTAPEVVFDAFHPMHRSNPYPRYAAVREFAALYPIRPDILMATRYEECSAVFTDALWGHGYEDGINPFRPGVAPDDVPGSMVRMDPPTHTRVRGLVKRAFVPRTTEGLRGRIEGLVGTLLDAAIEAGEVDLMEAFARPLPLTIIGDLLGIPPADYPEVQKWSLEIVRGTDPDILQSPECLARRSEAMLEFEAYFAGLLTLRRADARDDMLTGMAAAEDRGELTGREALGLASGLLIGGYETVSDVIGKGVVALLRNPDQIALWLADPELAGPAVDELLRYEPPVQFTHRVALAEREVAGHTFARGEGIVILTAAANRDPAVYADPERLDITRFAGRSPAPRHLSFSEGLHYCLGAHLGRLETQLAVDALLRRSPALRLAGEPIWRDTVAIHGLDTLPVRLRN
ncbi:cytochrome P450 [Frankia sp. AgB1.9]|uniref:cytochrome P450 n=1 Tax=unclassified Frankia TaxID=2632575 RepID=UPI001934565C|nr:MULTISPECIES: cytochrome P450 [unclassified Frankia]MBL7493603.1 cytochrome P450 [Frankia sp. AgW1.1]MBL7551378.1 cytochrome P450 [Frankia sp. AgB1.9]MBL7618953.1 cytochrome P450 [Frankia sp. AgB1.8]